MAEKLDLGFIERIARYQCETGGRLTANPKTVLALIARIRELESGIDSLASTLANVDKAVRETLGIDLDADDALPELVAEWMEERAQHAGEAREPVDLIGKLRAAYEKVSVYPEDRMRPDAVVELGPGFTDLLELRNLVPQAIAALAAAPEHGLTDERILAEWDKQWETADGVISIRNVVCRTVRAMLAAAPQPRE